jgi:hypothetical protein
LNNRKEKIVSYKYEDVKQKIFTEDNQIAFLAARDIVNHLLDKAGAVSMNALLKTLSGDSWLSMAFVDRLVEIGEIEEIPRGSGIAAQYRIFIKPNQ